MNNYQRLTKSRAAMRTFAVLAALLMTAVLFGSASAQEGNPVYDAVSLDAEIDLFLGPLTDYAAVDVDALEADIEEVLPATGSVFLASGSLSPLAKALLALEVSDGTLERTRHNVSLRVLLVDQPPAADPVPMVFMQVDRYNLGPAIRDGLIAELGEEHVAPAAAFGEGPHVSWRLVMRPLMGQQANIVEAARAELDEPGAEASLCLGIPCLLTSGGIDEVAVWQEMERFDLGEELGGLGYPAMQDAVPSPAAMLDLTALQAYFNAYEFEVTGSDVVVAEFVVESGLAQDQIIDVALRQGNLLDDSLAAIWQRLLALPTMEAAPEFYAAQAYECRRGDEGFAAPGEFCP